MRSWFRILTTCLLIAVLLSGGALASEAPEPTPEAADVTPEPTEVPTVEPEPDDPVEKPTGRTLYAKKDSKLLKKNKSKAKVLANIQRGESVYEEATLGNWSKVVFKGKTGYVKTSRFTTKAPEVQSEDIKVDKLTGENGMVDLDPRKKPGKNWAAQIVLAEGGLPIPQLFQADYPQVVCTYNGKPRSAATSGCGTTSLSMIIAYLTGDYVQNPHTLFREACQQGYYHGSGLGHEAIAAIAERYGVRGEWKALSGKSLLKVLRSDTPVIAHMGEGLFTEGGHYIVLRGATDDDKVLVNDPASRDNSTKAYPIELFVAESKSAEPFMLCSPITSVAQTPAPQATVQPDAGQKETPVRTPPPATQLQQ